jgi:hypothetical protein
MATRSAALVVVLTVLALPLALAPRAEAFVYWTNILDGTIGRANLNGTGVDQFFIAGVSEPSGVAVDAAHVYWANGLDGRIGRANLNGTAVDQGFIAGPGGPVVSGMAVDAGRSFGFGQVKRNNTNGTAKLTTRAPGPGELVLARTKQVKGDEARAAAVGGASAPTSQNEIEVELAVKPRGKAKKKLNRKGKAKVKAVVTYTPDGSDPTIVGSTDAKTVKLIKR